MLQTAAVTVLSLLASVALSLVGWGTPAAVAHLAFAVGIVPLIFAAMGHFVPVLTRSRHPERAILLLPAGAQLAGLAAVAAMAGLAPRWLLHSAATLDLVLAIALLAWIFRRARACLGSPHPGWRWYPAALGMLALALLSVPPMLAIPGLYGALRAVHLHLNTLGFVGLAALGTLPVLVPTALSKPDPEAANWLRRRLPAVIAAVILVATGAALAWPLALAGGLLLILVLLDLGRQWWRCFGPSALVRDGAAASLGAAALGLLFNLLAGMGHGAGLLWARPAIAAWAVGFLLPLVTGALSQLLPVWRWPGPTIPARAVMRSRLVAGGRWRGAFFLAGSLALAAGFPLVGGVLAGAGMLLFAASLARAMGVPASAR